MKISKILMKDAIKTIEVSQARFLSIIAIVALGISFFTGMNATAPDMFETAKQYVSSSNAMDIQLVSTAGLTDDDLTVIGSITGVEAVRGEKYVDGVVKVDSKSISDIDGSELTIRAISLNVEDVENYQNGVNDPSYMNRPQLVEGSWPSSFNQCVVDESQLSTPEEFKIGSVITIEGEGTDITASLSNTEYTIVGIIRTPLYMSYERGNTNIGTGKLGTFVYIPSDNFKSDYYTSMSIKIKGSENYDPYSEEYEQFISPFVNYISSIAPEVLAPRVNSLKAEYTVKIAEAETEYATTKANVEYQIANGEQQVEQVLDLAENGDQRLLEYKQQYNEKATEVANEIDAGKLEHSTQYAKWEEKRDQYNKAMETVEKYKDADTQLANAKTEWNVASLQVNTLSSTVSYLEQLVATTRSAMDQFNSSQDDKGDAIINRFEQSGLQGVEIDQIISTISGLTAVGTAEEMSAYMEPQLQSFEAKLTTSKQELSDAKTELAEKKVLLEQAQELVDTLNELEVKLETAKVELDKAEQELNDAGYDIQMGELEALAKLSDMKNQISTYETNLIYAKDKAKTIEAEFAATKQEATQKLEMAENALNDAKNFLLNLDDAKWYVNNRDEALLGFSDYEQTANRTAALSKIFPWFFFLVAALVCLNTMTRMIEEERTRLGTFKALGFTDSEIIFKYIFYAFLASCIGAFAGSFLGFALFPSAITMAYSILFDMPQVVIKYRFEYAIPGILISVISTVWTAYHTCNKNLRVVPASLMRPKAPKGGKKVFIEKFTFIWSRLNFIWKVTLRNVFRNMKRFVMATMGVAGCTALLVAGFGLNDSLNTTMEKQFIDEDRVWNYDMQIVLADSYDTTLQQCEVFNTVCDKATIKTAMLQYMKVFNTTSEKSENVMETYLLVPEKSEEVSNYISLRNRADKIPHTLNSNGVIITEKLADQLSIGVGDYIDINIDETNKVSAPVAAITENYAFHYIYMTKEVYQSLFGTNPKYNYICANLAIETFTDEQKNTLAKELMDDYDISAVAFTSQIESSMKNVMDSIGYVVIILIVSAGLLAFIVLYNLSIINITERMKEIATIKVLGFDDGEVSAYIFRENLILTIIGIIEGLLCGIVLHYIVISIAEVDIIMFGRGITPMSFVYSAALACAFSLFVNVVLHKKLKSVDMVESLKSIE